MKHKSNPTIQRMRASRLPLSEFRHLGRLARTADGDRLGFLRRMSTIATSRTLAFTFALLALCSCTAAPTAPVVSSNCDLPGDVSINEDAGRGSPIFVRLRLVSGEEWPFMVDTGNEWTLVDKSLEPRLGRRIGSNTSTFFGGTKASGGLWLAPQLYLGKTPLRSFTMERSHTNVVMTADLQELASGLHHPMMGILGMDCLQYYCIQIDFQRAKLRFLNPARLKAARLGKMFPLTYDTNGCPRIAHGTLLATKGDYAMVDTGYYPGDGALEPRLLQAVRQQEPGLETPTTQFRGVAQTCYPACVWSGITYTNLLLGEGVNLIGLRFLARHLVTLDFPNDKMYLRPTTPGPPAGDWYVKLRARSESATAFISDLIKRGQLPGGTRNLYFDFQDESNSATFHFPKEDNSSVYHCTVAAPSQSSAWKVQRAWRTDQAGHTLEEYPAP
jgi:hypothetical protein